MPALTAKRFNPVVSIFCERLLARGKCQMQVIHEGWLYLSIVLDLFSRPGDWLLHAATDHSRPRAGCLAHGSVAAQAIRQGDGPFGQ